MFHPFTPVHTIKQAVKDGLGKKPTAINHTTSKHNSSNNYNIPRPTSTSSISTMSSSSSTHSSGNLHHHHYHHHHLLPTTAQLVVPSINLIVPAAATAATAAAAATTTTTISSTPTTTTSSSSPSPSSTTTKTSPPPPTSTTATQKLDPFHLPEIRHLIFNLFLGYKDKLSCLLVCRQWCLYLRPCLFFAIDGCLDSITTSSVSNPHSTTTTTKVTRLTTIQRKHGRRRRYVEPISHMEHFGLPWRDCASLDQARQRLEKGWYKMNVRGMRSVRVSSPQFGYLLIEKECRYLNELFVYRRATVARTAVTPTTIGMAGQQGPGSGQQSNHGGHGHGPGGNVAVFRNRFRIGNNSSSNHSRHNIYAGVEHFGRLQPQHQPWNGSHAGASAPSSATSLATSSSAPLFARKLRGSRRNADAAQGSRDGREEGTERRRFFPFGSRNNNNNNNNNNNINNNSTTSHPTASAVSLGSFSAPSDHHHHHPHRHHPHQQPFSGTLQCLQIPVIFRLIQLNASRLTHLTLQEDHHHLQIPFEDLVNVLTGTQPPSSPSVSSSSSTSGENSLIPQTLGSTPLGPPPTTTGGVAATTTTERRNNRLPVDDTESDSDHEHGQGFSSQSVLPFSSSSTTLSLSSPSSLLSSSSSSPALGTGTIHLRSLTLTRACFYNRSLERLVTYCPELKEFSVEQVSFLNDTKPSTIATTTTVTNTLQIDNAVQSNPFLDTTTTASATTTTTTTATTPTGSNTFGSNNNNNSNNNKTYVSPFGNLSKNRISKLELLSFRGSGSDQELFESSTDSVFVLELLQALEWLEDLTLQIWDPSLVKQMVGALGRKGGRGELGTRLKSLNLIHDPADYRRQQEQHQQQQLHRQGEQLQQHDHHHSTTTTTIINNNSNNNSNSNINHHKDILSASKQDRILTRFLKSATKGLETLILADMMMGPESVYFLTNNHHHHHDHDGRLSHSKTISWIDLSKDCKIKSSEMQTIMTTCPGLIHLDFGTNEMDIQDIVTMGCISTPSSSSSLSSSSTTTTTTTVLIPWICTKLITLHLYISDQRPNFLKSGQIWSLTQQQFFKQLSLLFNLQHLRIISRMQSTEFHLSMTIENGIFVLKTLERLKVFETKNLGFDLGWKEVEWINSHWDQLERLVIDVANCWQESEYLKAIRVARNHHGGGGLDGSKKQVQVLYKLLPFSP